MATQDSRILIKRTATSGVVPTVPSSSDHTDGTWVATDIYKGELFFNQADGVLWTRDDNGVNCIGGSTSLTIANADVLQLNSTPLTIVPAVAGYAIEVISASLKIDFNTTAYATNTMITLITSGATEPQADNDIDATVSRIGRFRNRSTSGVSVTATQIITNADLQVSVDLGDPTAGDSDITVYVHYRYI